jgi:hypothetical protein
MDRSFDGNVGSLYVQCCFGSKNGERGRWDRHRQRRSSSSVFKNTDRQPKSHDSQVASPASPQKVQTQGNKATQQVDGPEQQKVSVSSGETDRLSRHATSVRQSARASLGTRKVCHLAIPTAVMPRVPERPAASTMRLSRAQPLLIISDRTAASGNAVAEH